MNVRALFCLLTLVWMTGCGKTEKMAEPPAVVEAPPATPTPPPAPPEPPPAPPPAPAPAMVLTPEVESAVVFVRVAVAATLLREHTGVILSRQAVSPGVPAQSMRRFVAVQLPAYDEAALRDPSCTIMILRKKFDPSGQPRVMQYAGTLVHFDAKTHGAILQFTEDFPYRLETGLSPDAAGTGMEGLHLLQATYNPQAPGAALPKPEPPQYGRPVPPGTALPGMLEVSLLPAAMKEGMLKTDGPATPATSRMSAVAVLSSEGLLAGFATRGSARQQGWEFQALALPPVLEEQGLSYVIQSATTTGGGGLSSSETFTLDVKGVLKDPLKEYRSLKVVVQNMPSAEFTPPASPQTDQEAIQADKMWITANLSPEGNLRIIMGAPQGETASYRLVQVWLMKEGEQVVFHSAPFMVVSRKRGAGAYYSVVGLPGQSETPPMPAAPPETPTPTPLSPPPGSTVAAGSKELKTENPIIYGQPICEGREVLFHLDGAPFWKRLSLAEGHWLSMPVADLSLCLMTGNKDALFVLHPGAGEISRYNADTLRLEKTAKLPNGPVYQGLAAGCLSDDAPVAVITDLGVLPCDPKELTMRVRPNMKRQGEPKTETGYHYLASGDGSLAFGFPYKRDHYSPHPLVFSVSGVKKGNSAFNVGSLPTVSSSCIWGEVIQHGIQYPGSPVESHQFLFNRAEGATSAPLANTPNFFAVARAVHDRDGRLLHPPQCSFYSYFSEEPWATVDVPEAGDIPLGDWASLKKRVWLDASTLTLAVWHHTQTITLHTLDRAKLPEPKSPVLLNYPDCFASRGGDFTFTPNLLGSAPQVTTTDTPPGFTTAADGRMDWHVAQDAVQRQVVFGMQMSDARPAQRPRDCKVALFLGGEPPVAAVPASLDAVSGEAALAAAGGKGLQPLPLTSRTYHSEGAIQRVEPGLNDYLALMMQDKTLALLSPKDLQLAGSTQLGGSTAFMGGDAVFLYNTTSRELSRLSLPDFTVTARVPLPSSARLFGLAVGVNPDGPLTLLLTETVSILPKGGRVPMPQQETRVLILDKQTLAVGKWAAYIPKKEPGRQLFINEGLSMVHDAPPQIPCSNDGRLLSLCGGLLMISPAVTVGFDYSQKGPNPSPTAFSQRLSFHGHTPVSASPTGGRVFSLDYHGPGYLYHNDYPYLKLPEGRIAMSPCGNYLASLKVQDVPPTKQIKLYAADDGRPLFNLAGADILSEYDGEYDDARRQVTPLGEKNLLTVLSQGGRELQVIDLDVAATTQALDPAAAYVTSHPFPVVAQGHTLDYQVTVNNPAAVEGYELRDNTSGATIDKTGHLVYHAPVDSSGSTQTEIIIRIRLKNKETLLHQFPIYAIHIGPVSSPKPGAK